MEESKVAARQETVDNKEKKKSVVKQAVKVTSEEMSDAGSVNKEAEARRNRLKLFNKVLQKSLEKVLEHASFNRFASTFRPLYKKDPQRMESIHKQFIEELQRTIQDDICRLMEEGRLEFKLSELDKLESAAKNSPKAAWRPSGVPEKDFCSFLMPYYQKQEAYMKLELKKIQAENASLAKKVQAGRERIAQTENRISTAVDEWKTSVTEFERLASSLCPAQAFDV